MGQKVNPHGLRVGVIKDWDSRWFAKDKDFGDTLVEDYNLRKHLKKKLYGAGVDHLEPDRGRPCGHDPLYQAFRTGLDQDFSRQAHHRKAR